MFCLYGKEGEREERDQEDVQESQWHQSLFSFITKSEAHTLFTLVYGPTMFVILVFVFFCILTFL